MIQGSRVGKLGTYCLIVLMVLETSLLPCLGPKKPELQLLVPGSQQAGCWEFSGIPSWEPFLLGPTKVFSPELWAGFLIHETAPESSENPRILFPDCVLMTKGALEIPHLLS